VAEGPPESIAKVKHSYTGRFLAQRLSATRNAERGTRN